MLKRVLARIRPLYLRSFGLNVALSCRLYRYKEIRGKGLRIGRNTQICEGAWLVADSCSTINQAELMISEGCHIGYNNHVFAVNNITIEQDVLTGNNVLITDATHEFRSTETAIRNQPILSSDSITIGRGSWIAENVAIIGASIGQNCVVGANSVVTKDVPDYCVVVGNPSRIVKKYNVEKKIWEKF